MKKRKNIRKIISTVATLSLTLSLFVCAVVPAQASSDGVITRRGFAVCGPDDPDCPWKSNNITHVAAALNACSISTSTLQSTYDYPAYVKYQITKYFTITNSADDDDVNYLYLTGHGNASAINVGCSLSYSTLKQTLDAIPGHFVVFFQCCHSGGAIGRGEGEKSIEEQIIENFFADESDDAADDSLTENRGAFEGNAKYTVFCSCEASQDSGHTPGVGGYSRSTYGWLKGLGYDITATPHTCTKYADVNGDYIVTADELHNYAYAYVNSVTTDYDPCYYSKYPFETVYTSYYRLGDASLDGAITLADVQLIQDYLDNLANLNWRQEELADVDADGVVTSADATLIYNYVNGI